MPVGVTTTSREVYELHMLILWVCVDHRRRRLRRHDRRRSSSSGSRRAPCPPSSRTTATVEVIWTVIPAVILVAMAVPAAETLIRMEDTRESELTIKVTGYQWRWHYDYIDDGVGFFSTLDRESNAARRLDSGIDPTTVDNYLLEGRQRGRRARRHEGALARHGGRRAARVVGAGVRASRRTPCRASSTKPGSRPTRRAPIAASAPSSAAWITASCRSSCASRAKRSTTRG